MTDSFSFSPREAHTHYIAKGHIVADTAADRRRQGNARRQCVYFNTIVGTARWRQTDSGLQRHHRRHRRRLDT